MTYNRNRLNDISDDNLHTIAYLSLNGISTTFNANQTFNKWIDNKQVPIETVSVLTLRDKAHSFRIENIDIHTDIDLKELILQKTEKYKHSDNLKSSVIDERLKYLYMLKYLMLSDSIKYKAEYNTWPNPREDEEKYQKLLEASVKYQELVDGHKYLNSPLIQDYIKTERTKYKRHIYYLRRINSLLKN